LALISVELTTNKIMAALTKFVHISTISNGDTVIHESKMRTVNAKDHISRSEFMGVTLFGDSFKLGTVLIEKVVKWI
jgi:hypothetical protein